MLAPGKHTPTYPASSAPDTRCRSALPKPCNVGPDAAAPPPRQRRHRAHPSARHPRPPDQGPRTPPPQRRRVPARHRTVPRSRAWDARASIVSGATAARPCVSKPSRRKDQRPRSRPPRPRAAPSPPPRSPPERRRAEDHPIWSPPMSVHFLKGFCSGASKSCGCDRHPFCCTWLDDPNLSWAMLRSKTKLRLPA